jgi:hypothetical protein
MPRNEWVQFENPGRDAPVRTWGSCAFDTDEGKLIYWGGGHCGYGGNDYDLYDVGAHTWISSPIESEYPERAWNRGSGGHLMGITFGGAPWPQNLCEMTALVYDSKRERILLHGGGPDRDELWSAPAGKGSWERIEPSGDSGPACAREAVYIPSQDVLLTAGSKSGEEMPAFWVYDCSRNRWQKVAIGLPKGLSLENMKNQRRAWLGHLTPFSISS